MSPNQWAVIVAALFLLPVVGAASTVEVSNQTASPTPWMQAFDAPQTAVADFDGDGKAELVAHNDNQYIYVLSTTTSRVLASFKPDYPWGWPVRPINDPAVADIDGDGNLSIIVVTSAAAVCDYEYVPETSTATSFKFAKRWCSRMDGYEPEPAADGGAAVGDIDGDGKMEIFAQTEGRGLYAYRYDGTVLWSKPNWGGNSGPVLADLENDEKREVIFFGDAGEVTAWDAKTGATKWAYYANSRVNPASIPVAGAVADLENDGWKEIIFVARDAHDATNYANDHLMLFVLNSNGKLRWAVQPSWANPMSYAHPVVHDLNGDGYLDILIQDWNTIGHKPGNWEKLGPANVFAYQHDGTFMWRTEIDNSWSNDDVGLADMDGDGQLEVFTIGYGPGGDGMWQLDAKTGAKERHTLISGWTVLRGPTLGDFTGTGKLSWAVPVNIVAKGGAYVISHLDVPCVVAYGGMQNKHLCPKNPPPPQPTPPFAVQYTTGGGNQWWVTVDVASNRAVAQVDARIGTGTWQPLSLRSWGAWAASFYVPDGSLVSFRTTTAGGETNISGSYRWPDGTLVAPTPPPPPPPPAPTPTPTPTPSGNYTPLFTTNGGNDWWVAVRVTAPTPPTLVEARLGDGTWRPLTLRSWGEWAASFNVPAGSILTFRATNATGAQAISNGYAWPGGAPATTGQTFAAQFGTNGGNEWWVAVRVDANQPVTGVEARAGDAAWQQLTLRTWGEWAASFNVYNGTLVEFRATNNTGTAVTSGKYVWPSGTAAG